MNVLAQQMYLQPGGRVCVSHVRLPDTSGLLLDMQHDSFQVAEFQSTLCLHTPYRCLSFQGLARTVLHLFPAL